MRTCRARQCPASGRNMHVPCTRSFRTRSRARLVSCVFTSVQESPGQHFCACCRHNAADVSHHEYCPSAGEYQCDGTGLRGRTGAGTKLPLFCSSGRWEFYCVCRAVSAPCQWQHGGGQRRGQRRGRGGRGMPRVVSSVFTDEPTCRRGPLIPAIKQSTCRWGVEMWNYQIVFCVMPNEWLHHKYKHSKA